MPGNYHTNFKRYKRKLRWKAAMRKESDWKPEGWDEELFSPSGHRCPMCKSHRLIEEGNSLLCSDCGWAGQKLDLPEDQLPPSSQ